MGSLRFRRPVLTTLLLISLPLLALRPSPVGTASGCDILERHLSARAMARWPNLIVRVVDILREVLALEEEEEQEEGASGRQVKAQPLACARQPR